MGGYCSTGQKKIGPEYTPVANIEARYIKDRQDLWDRVRQYQCSSSEYVKMMEIAYEDHINPFLIEENKGHALLQRRLRLLNIQSSIKEMKSESDDEPPSYSVLVLSEDQEKKLQAEISGAINHFWKSKREMFSELKVIPGVALTIVEWFMLSCKRRDQYSRLFRWKELRNQCALSGGCCGRDCGCCEKPLLPFMQINDSGEKEPVSVYGHCTSECSCCIRIRGCYDPHAQLPPTEFVSEEYW